MSAFFAAIDGLKYPATPRPVQCFFFGPGGVSAVEIAEFHLSVTFFVKNISIMR